MKPQAPRAPQTKMGQEALMKTRRQGRKGVVAEGTLCKM